MREDGERRKGEKSRIGLTFSTCPDITGIIKDQHRKLFLCSLRARRRFWEEEEGERE